MIRSITSRVSRPVIASLLLFAFAACSHDGGTGPTATPTQMRIDAGNMQAATVGTPLPTLLQVTVLDASGAPVVGTRVDWDISVGSGTVSSASTNTDSKGQARVTWTLGTVAGAQHVSAQISGVTPAAFVAQGLPGQATQVVAIPDALALGIGDTITLHSSVRDTYGNEITGPSVAYSTPDAVVASVSATGFVTALSVGTARVIVSAVKADTVIITVGPAGTSACGNIVAQQLAVGQVFKPTSSGDVLHLCLSATTTNAEYGLIAYSSTPLFGNVKTFEAYGLGLTAAASPILASDVTSGASLVASLGNAALTAANDQSKIPAQFERARRDAEQRDLGVFREDARSELGARAQSRSASTFASLQAATPVPAVGTYIQLNSQGLSACGSADTRVGRVAAVGNNAIAVVDTTNPTSGYTDADYQSIVATFDTLVYPMDTTNFGAPTNLSGNGHIILFYTKAVNALTPAGANYIIGGFFFARDLYPKSACAGSNVTEMFYLLVPDPNGVVNNNKRTKDQVTKQNLGTIAHEFQHLINASRRMYINNASANEETWLDEGLSHVAEELLYFRMSGFGARDNLLLSQVAGTQAAADMFSAYQGSNFARLYEDLRDPEVNSPYATNDSLSTRGATWSFLRYAAGRQTAGAEQAFFRSVVNSQTTGLANLRAVLAPLDLDTFFNDWAVSTFTDDYLLLPQDQLAANYKVPAWNYRNIFPALRPTGNQALGVYPLAVRQLGNNLSQKVNLVGGGSGYFRFAVAANRKGFISLSTNGQAPGSQLNFNVVRLR